MTDDCRSALRAARRSDLQRLGELRMRYLGEAAHDEQRLRLMPEARARTEQALPVWMGQDDRVLIVAEAESTESVNPGGPADGAPVETAAPETAAPDAAAPDAAAPDAAAPDAAAPDAAALEVVAYAMGVLNTAPPVLASQHVGEILEIYVLPEFRGRGIARALVAVLTEALCGRGAQVLRAALPVANTAGREQLRNAGYAPLQRILERRLDTV